MITKLNFNLVFKPAWESAATPANLVNGFKKCGIHPFDPSALSIVTHTGESVHLNLNTNEPEVGGGGGGVGKGWQCAD